MSSKCHFGFALFAALLLVGAIGCPEKDVPPPPPPQVDYGAPLPPGEKALVKLTDPAQFPDFREGFERRTGLEQAAMYSLEYLSKKSSQQHFPYLDVSHQRAVDSVKAFIDLLHTARTAEEFDQTIKSNFDIYISRGCDEKGTVLFTGYYCPIFDGRLQPDSQFKYPLYKKPDDLALLPGSNRYSRTNGSPYLTRAEIERGALAGRNLELVYLKDRFEAYIVTVQGSGRIRLADGTLYDIGYAGDNGYDYTSIGRRLIEEGKLPSSQLSLQGLIKFFQDHPEELERTLAVNNRYVFFTQRSGGPFGSLNVPVTPYRSIATDKEVYPRAGVSYLRTYLPARTATGEIRDHSYSGFAMDQDTGGAIRAAGRCDVFLGTGPEIGELAGRTMSEGRIYYIFVKEGSSPLTPAAPLPTYEPIDPPGTGGPST